MRLNHTLSLLGCALLATTALAATVVAQTSRSLRMTAGRYPTPTLLQTVSRQAGRRVFLKGQAPDSYAAGQPSAGVLLAYLPEVLATEQSLYLWDGPQLTQLRRTPENEQRLTRSLMERRVDRVRAAVRDPRSLGPEEQHLAARIKAAPVFGILVSMLSALNAQQRGTLAAGKPVILPTGALPRPLQAQLTNFPGSSRTVARSTNPRVGLHVAYDSRDIRWVSFYSRPDALGRRGIKVIASTQHPGPKGMVTGTASEVLYPGPLPGHPLRDGSQAKAIDAKASRKVTLSVDPRRPGESYAEAYFRELHQQTGLALLAPLPEGKLAEPIRNESAATAVLRLARDLKLRAIYEDGLLRFVR